MTVENGVEYELLQSYKTTLNECRYKHTCIYFAIIIYTKLNRLIHV